MKLEEQVTTFEQSIQLLNLGYEENDASLYWRLSSYVGLCKYSISCRKGLEMTSSVPCWTIADMMNIIQNKVKEIYWEECEAYHGAELIIDSNRYVRLRNIAAGDCDDIEFYKKELLRDNLYDCLVWLKENEYL